MIQVLRERTNIIEYFSGYEITYAYVVRVESLRHHPSSRFVVGGCQFSCAKFPSNLNPVNLGQLHSPPNPHEHVFAPIAGSPSFLNSHTITTTSSSPSLMSACNSFAGSGGK